VTVTVFTARTIVTMDSTQPSAEAVAVEDGRIVAVGSRVDVEAAVGDHPHVIDDTFADRVVLPGLIDQHLHPILGATTLATEVIATEDWVLPDRTYPAANTHEEYVDALRSADQRTRADGAGDDDWLFSWGYHQLWHGDLSRQVLDSVSATRPIGVWQRSCHEFYLNTAGLQSLGILDDGWGDGIAPEVLATADVESGHFWERGFFNLLFRQLTPMLLSPERLIHGLHQMVRYLHQNGVTAFNEPGAILVPGAWELYQEILGADDTPFFSYFLTDGRGPAEQQMAHDTTLARAEREYAMAPDGPDHTDRLAFFPKQVKLFADGAIINARSCTGTPDSRSTSTSMATLASTWCSTWSNGGWPKRRATTTGRSSCTSPTQLKNRSIASLRSGASSVRTRTTPSDSLTSSARSASALSVPT
jgi:predicted amidohydrolase YtcJ